MAYFEAESFLNLSRVGGSPDALERVLSRVQLVAEVDAIDLSGLELTGGSCKPLVVALQNIVEGKDSRTHAVKRVTHYALPSFGERPSFHDFVQRYVWDIFPKEVVATFELLDMLNAPWPWVDDVNDIAALVNLLKCATSLRHVRLPSSVSHVPQSVASALGKMVAVHLDRVPNDDFFESLQGVKIRFAVSVSETELEPVCGISHNTCYLCDEHEKVVERARKFKIELKNTSLDWVAAHSRAQAATVTACVGQTFPSAMSYEPRTWTKKKIYEWQAKLGTRGQYNSNRSVGIAVIDSGIDAGHSYLYDNIGHAKSFVYGCHPWLDLSGHGTFVAGIIAGIPSGSSNQIPECVGIAPQTNLIVLQVFDASELTSTDVVAEAIEYAVNIDGCDIISLSLGGGFTPRLYNAIHSAEHRNKIVICAATNSGQLSRYSIGYPARFGSPICVGSHGYNGEPSLFSSVGREVDFLAPGVDIRSTYPFDSFANLSGTSFAAPFVSGLVALLIAHDRNTLAPKLTTTAAVRAILRAFSTCSGYHDQARGYGVLDAEQVFRLDSANLCTFYAQLLNDVFN